MPSQPSAETGLGQVVLNLYDRFDTRGPFRPLFFIESRSDRSLRASVHDGRRVLLMRLRYPWGRHGPLTLFLFLITLPAALLRWARVLERERITAVNMHYPGPTGLLFVIGKRLGLFRIRTVLSIHGTDIRAGSRLPFVRRWMYRQLFRYSDDVVACSKGLAAEFIALGYVSRQPVKVVRNGIDPARFIAEAAAESNDPELPTGRRVITCVANFLPHKGHDILVRAFARLAPRYPDLDLALVSLDLPHRQVVEELVAALGLHHRVHVLTNLSHGGVGRVLERTTVFALPSRAEPFGLVLLEAGVFGLPVVASAVGGIPEIIEDGTSGLLVTPDDLDGLAAAMSSLLDDPGRARSMGLRLQDRVQAAFSWDDAARQYAAIYADQVDTSRRNLQ